MMPTHSVRAALILSLVATAGAASAAETGAQTGGEPDELVAAEVYGAAAWKTDPASVDGLVGKGSGAVWACASCHGDKGEGNDTIPRLAGLAPGYIAKQLYDYRSGKRINANMEYVVKGLTDEQILALSHHYAILNVASTVKPALDGDLARGERLALDGDWNIGVPGCFDCHGASGWGVEEAFPALAAQQPAYTYAQLGAWTDTRRTNSPLALMQHISAQLADTDMRAIADYLATLPAPPAQKEMAND